MTHGFIRDLRHAARALARSPRLTVIVAFTLALAIGANAAIFSAVNGILLRPLPFPDADRVVGIFSTAPGLGYPQFPVSADLFQFYREEVPSFEDMGIYNGFEGTLADDGSPEILSASRMSPSTFSTLGVTPLRGRIHSSEEDATNESRVVVISEGLWERRYASDPDILGKTIDFNGETRDIIGVMPADFDFPTEDTDLWLPTGIDPESADPGSFSWSAVGRLKAGLDAAGVQDQMAPVVARIPERYPGEESESLRAFVEEETFGVILEPLRETVIGDVTAPLWILLGTVGFVLLIACANVSNLLLVRTESRQKELAVRAALGAGKSGLLSHYLAESAVLAGLGGLGGLALAWLGVPALVAAAPPNLPRLGEVGLDARVLLFTLGVTLLAAFLFVLIPVTRYSGPALLATLKVGARGSTSGRENNRTRNALVVAQTALALVLLVGSGLMVRSFWELRHADPGFDTRGMLTFRVGLPTASYPGAVQAASFYQEFKERLEGLPGVESVGGATNIPLASGASGTAFTVEDAPTPAGELPPLFWYKFVTADYFETLGIPLVAGRTFRPSDHQGDLGNVIVNTIIADRYWPDEDPLGKRIRFNADSTGWYRIVGVVGATRERGLREDPIDHLYFPMVGIRGDEGPRVEAMTFAIKARNAGTLAPAVRAQLWEMDGSLPIASMQTMEEILSNSMVRLTFTMLALALSALMALVLGAVGLYGVLSYVVTQRTREIGIRLALGAEEGSVMKLVVGQGVRLAAVGIVLGLLGAVGLTRILQSLLFETRPLDLSVLLGMSGLLFSVGAAAAYLPARRAARVDPVAALRRE